MRLTLGSQGTAGNNDSNWIRGNGTSLGFNAAGGATTWEVSGAQKMSLSSTGALVIQDALTVNGNISNSAASTYFYLNNVGTGNSGLYIGGISARMRFHVPASNYYEWEIGGAHKMRLDANGNLGIGTNAPGMKLDVVGNARFTATAANPIWLAANNNIKIFASESYNRHLNFSFYDSTAGSYRTILFIDGATAGSGRVGIGQATPLSLLHLKQAAGANIRFENATKLLPRLATS